MTESHDRIVAEIGRTLREIPENFEEEHRQDGPFRFCVFADQIGDIARHISHDPSINPPTRPMVEDEEVAYGDAIVQLLILAHQRDIDLAEAITIGRERWVGGEGYKIQEAEMQGIVANKMHNDVYVGDIGQDVGIFRELDPNTQTIDQYDVILTEIGGMSSHSAKLAREMGISAVVGIEGLTENVMPHHRVRVDLETGEVSSFEL